MSIFGNSRIVNAGAVNRFGPIVNPGRRIPIREKRAGSVRILMPKKLISTVACPSHAAVTHASFHSAGFGFAKARAIGRRLSIVHSRQRCAIQFRRAVFSLTRSAMVRTRAAASPFQFVERKNCRRKLLASRLLLQPIPRHLITPISARRFFAQADSLCSESAGISRPKLTV